MFAHDLASCGPQSEKYDQQMSELRTITADQLAKIVAAHAEWLASDGKSGQAADLSHCELTGVRFPKADLRNANFSHAHLVRADFAGAMLEGADFTGADMTRADLAGADIQNAKLDGATLSEAALGDARMEGASLKEIGRASCRERV